MKKHKKRKIIVYTAGSFDMLNIGHLHLLKKSKKLGDRLIVGVSSDKLIKFMKHSNPIHSYKNRAAIIQSIRYVDEVVRQDFLLDVNELKKIHPNIITIGSDWKKINVLGLIWAKKNGIKVVYLPYTMGISSTIIKERIIRNSYAIIKAQLKREDNK